MTSENGTTGKRIFYYWEAPGPERYAFGICGSEEEARHKAENEIRARKAEYGSINRADLHSDGVYGLVPYTGKSADPQIDGTIIWADEECTR